MRYYKRHACCNSTCPHFMAEVMGTIPGICPGCGWQRILASITTYRVV